MWYSYHSDTEGNSTEKKKKNSSHVAKFPNGISLNTITTKLIVSSTQDKKLNG